MQKIVMTDLLAGFELSVSRAVATAIGLERNLQAIPASMSLAHVY